MTPPPGTTPGTAPVRARHVAAPTPARRRRRRAPQPAPGGRRRRAATPEAVLRAEALAAAEILARHSGFWGPDEILEHPEIAALAATEARQGLAAAEKGTRSVRRAAGRDRLELDQALEVLAHAHRDGIVA